MKKSTRFVATVLALVMSFCAFGGALLASAEGVAPVTYKVTAVEDVKGVVTVTVTLPDSKEVNSGKVVVAVSDKLTLIDVNASGVNGTVNKEYTYKDADGSTSKGVAISFASADAFASGTVVAVLTYQKTAGAELGDADVFVPEWNLSDVNSQRLGYRGWQSKIDGTETLVNDGLADITVTPFTVLLGDVNDDGAIDNADAAAVLRHDAGLTKLNDAQQAAADVNDDGIVDNSDAALILRYDAGIIKNF